MTRPTLQPDPTLVVGAKGEQVRRMQVALNSHYPALNLRTDGEFDGDTAFAITRFQRDGWLVISGEADFCTQNALLGGEAYPPIRHVRPFIPQPSATTCWSACTAMFKSSSVAAVTVATPPELIRANGTLDNLSNIENWRPKTEAFARAHNLRFEGSTTFPPGEFVKMLAHGPIIVDTLWKLDYKHGAADDMGSPGHFTLVVGCRGDGEMNGLGTTLMVYDPWKPTVGRQWRVNYAFWITEELQRIYRLFY